MYRINTRVHIDTISIEVLISINEACRLFFILVAILYNRESPFYLVLCTDIILVKLYSYIRSIHTFNTYGVWLRHRALRFNLLSKNHSKGFPLQSLTQNHYYRYRFVKWKIDFYMELLSYRKD